MKERIDDMVTFTIPIEQARNILYLQEDWIFDTIRNDPEADNIRWLRLQLDTYDNIAKAIGETDSNGEQHE